MGAKNKVYSSFDDAVRDIPDGATLGFGGFAVVGMPVNLYAAVAKQGARNLTCVSSSTRGGATLPADAPDMGQMIKNGQVKKVICAFTAPTRASQRLILSEYVDKGLIEAELVPQGTLAERMRAAGAGIPAFYTPAAVGTELAECRAMSERAKGLSRQQMCDRLAMEFEDGWIVNLGIGIPTLCSNFDFGDKEIIFHSENGVIGYGPLAAPGREDLHLVNAGGQHVTLQPGAAIVHHADSFALIRSGRIDVTVLGAYEVAENGDFANWKMAGQQGGGIGGAMDLAACAKHVFVAMEHQTRARKPRLVERCAIPATARGVVNLVATNFGLFEITPQGLALREIAPGVTVEEIKDSTGCNLIVPVEVPPVRTVP